MKLVACGRDVFMCRKIGQSGVSGKPRVRRVKVIAWESVSTTIGLLWRGTGMILMSSLGVGSWNDIADGSSFPDHFAALRDPRQSWKAVYSLPEVRLTVLSGTIAGAELFVEIRRGALLHTGVLRRFPITNDAHHHAACPCPGRVPY